MSNFFSKNFDLGFVGKEPKWKLLWYTILLCELKVWQNICFRVVVDKAYVELDRSVFLSIPRPN